MAYFGKINTKTTDISLLPVLGKMPIVSLSGLLLTFQDSVSDPSSRVKMSKEKF